MKPLNAANGNERIEQLRKREAALKTAIAAERIKQQKRDEKDKARLAQIVGAVLVERGNSSPEFRAMIAEILDGAVTDVPTRKLLVGRGWL